MTVGKVARINSSVEERAICLKAYNSVHEGDPCEADGSDLREADDGKLATASSLTPQLLLRFSEASHAAKTFFFFAASLLKVKKLQPSPLS